MSGAVLIAILIVTLLYGFINLLVGYYLGSIRNRPIQTKIQDESD